MAKRLFGVWIIVLAGCSETLPPMPDAAVFADAGPPDSGPVDAGCIEETHVGPDTSEGVLFAYRCGSVRWVKGDAEACFPPHAVWAADDSSFTALPDRVEVEHQGDTVSWDAAECLIYSYSDDGLAVHCRREEYVLMGTWRWAECEP